MFGTSGIRGPVGDEVTASLALAVGRALGVETDRVVVGRDPRPSGEVLRDALRAGLRESGTAVVDLGLAATPTVARSVGWWDADAGVAVTASHNPPPDNGIKLFEPSGQGFAADARQRIAQRVETGAASLASWDDIGGFERADARARHRDAIVDAVDLTAPIPVVVDLGNGAGGVTVDALGALGCDVETLNAQPDGTFPGRPSEPTAAHCTSLCSVVAGGDAVLGIAHDGDADRAMAVTADGSFLGGDVLLAILALATADPGDRVALPVDTSLAVEDALANADVGVTRTRVGDVAVAAAASQPDVVFGGEPSGSWIFPAASLCPDGPLAACVLAGLAAERSLADRAAEIETYPLYRTAIETDDRAARMAAIEAHVQAEYDAVSTLDGVRVDVDGGWFPLRASGTQPLIRVTAEARGADSAETLFETAKTIARTPAEPGGS